MTRALTLHQPWATLVALGVKTIETRSWAPPAAAIGERLLIHAGVKRPPAGTLVGTWHIGAEGMSTAVGGLRIEGLPLGAIVASCTLADVVPIATADSMRCSWDAEHAVRVADVQGRLMHLRGVQKGPNPLDWTVVAMLDDQRPYGDFAPGRFGWLLEDVQPTTERCPACWGERGRWRPDNDEDSTWRTCPTCDRNGVCEPVPATGRQRLWEWTPTSPPEPPPYDRGREES